MKFDLARIVSQVATVAVQMASQNPNIPSVTGGAHLAVGPIAQDVANDAPDLARAQTAVNQATTPMPFYRSSVLIGLLVSFVSLVAAAFGYSIDDSSQKAMIELLGFLGIVIGQGITLYARLASNLAPITINSTT